jgi:hypothetical protein
VKESPFLAPVQRIVGRVEVENDLCRRRAMRVDEQLDEQPLDRRNVVADLVIARRFASGRVLEPVERALAGQRRTARPACLELAGEDRHHRIVAQPIMVEQVLIPQRQAEDPLADQRRNLMLDPARRAPIAETAGEPLDEPDRLVGGPEQQRPGIRGHSTPIERCDHPTSLDHS